MQNDPEELTSDSSTSSATAWYAIRVRSNFERATATALRERQYTEFLPTYRVRRRWSDRTKEIECPLFPGYLFARFNPQYLTPILGIPGVVNVVGCGKTPAPVDEAEIRAIQEIITSHLPVEPWPHLQVGQRVLIEHGPLTGAEGFLLQVKKQYRLVVSLTLLQRSVAVDIDRPQQRARQLLTAVGLETRGSHYPAQLSGGEQQRIALARAFACRPSLLLADEPTGNLDSSTGDLVLEMLLELNRSNGATLVIVTHDPALSRLTNRIIRIRDGRIVEETMPGAA